MNILSFFYNQTFCSKYYINCVKDIPNAHKVYLSKKHNQFFRCAFLRSFTLMRHWTKKECIGLRNLKCNMVCEVFAKNTSKNLMETISNLAVMCYGTLGLTLQKFKSEIFVHKAYRTRSFAMCKSL